MHLKKKLSFSRKKVFVGIDVHRKTYFVSCRCDGETVKRCQIEADPEKLVSFFDYHFKGAEIEKLCMRQDLVVLFFTANWKRQE